MSVGAVYGGQGRNKVTVLRRVAHPGAIKRTGVAFPYCMADADLCEGTERIYRLWQKKNPDENNRSNFSESQREFVFTEIFDIIHLKYVYSIIEPLL